VWKGGRQARCRSGMEAEKAKEESRVPTGLHAHLRMGEKSNPSRAGPLTGLPGWARSVEWAKVGRAPSTTPGGTDRLTDGSRSRPELRGLHASTSPGSSVGWNPSRSGGGDGTTGEATGGEGCDDTSKNQDPTWSLNAEMSSDPQSLELTTPAESGGKSVELKETGSRRISGDLDLEALRRHSRRSAAPSTPRSRPRKSPSTLECGGDQALRSPALR
jgi:hypothetical protein